jgi:hypothetical protein
MLIPRVLKSPKKYAYFIYTDQNGALEETPGVGLIPAVD